MSQRGEIKDILLFMTGVVVLGSLLLALLAFMRPTTRTIPTDINYQHSGTFSYTASAPSGIYDSDTANTGDPIFRQLTTTVPITFDYRLATEQSSDVHGTYRLSAVLSDGNGWRRTLELQPQQPLNGSAVSTSGSINLQQIQELIDHFQKQTESTQREYTLTIAPTVEINGMLAGQPLRDEFAPKPEFQLNDRLMQLAQSSTAATTLNPVKPGVLKGSRMEPNMMGLFGLQLEVASARRGGSIGLVLGLMSLLALGVPTLRAAEHNETLRVRVKYGAALITIQHTNFVRDNHVIDVASIDDLARVAERIGSVILHAPFSASDCYLVQDGSVTYRYGNQAQAHLEAETQPLSETQWQVAFLDALSQTGRVADACTAAGVWLATANQERLRSPNFAQAWAEAQAQAQQFKPLAGHA